MNPATRIFGEHGKIIHDSRFRILFLANTTGALGIPVVAPILDSLTDPFGVTASQVGLITTVYTAPGILMIPLAGIVADKYGRKPILLAGLILFGCSGTAIIWTTNFTVVLLLRFVQGIGFAGIIPIVVTSIGDIYEGSRETTAQGIQFAALGLSTAIFSILAGFLVVFEWQYAFLLYTLALPVVAMMYLWFEEPMDTRYREPLSSGQSLLNTMTIRNEYIRELTGLMTHRRTFVILLARTVPSFIYVGFLTYSSFVIVELVNGTPQQAGLVVGVASLINAGASTQAGRLASFFGDRIHMLIWMNASMGLGMVLFGIADSFSVALLGTFTLGLGFGFTSGLYRSVITGLTPTEFRGGIVSLSESLGRLAATIAPLFIGSIISIGTKLVSYATSIRLAIIGTGLIASGFGVLCLFIAIVSES